ncbi:MAG: hypothetical protein BWY46_00227 [Firmicutes bacterium ADurb.Bin300]|nr:MAG: hypothetical protein BWY46_00227 [Firmicutes bacterium ADurb.Bin300]HOD03287.1 hypothetical protein [Clostridiales bacterium]
MSNQDISALLNSLSGEDFESLKKVASGLLGEKNSSGEVSESLSSGEANGESMNKSALPDMSKFASLAPLLGELTKRDDRTDFLMSLKPFLSEQRKPKADEAARLIRLINMIPLLRERGVL